jgi:hypothetical protein
MADSSDQKDQKTMDCIIALHKLELDAENYFKNRDLFNALNLHQKILQLKILLKNRVGQARTLYTMGKLYYEIGNVQKSQEYHKYLVDLLEDSTSNMIKIDFYKDLLEFYNSIGDNSTSSKIDNRLKELQSIS